MSKHGFIPAPAKVHLLRGNPGHKPAEKLAEQVNPDTEVPDFPKHLTTRARKEWARVTRELEKLDLIALIDRAALAAYCATWAEIEDCEEEIKRQNATGTLAGLVSVSPQTGVEHVSPIVRVRDSAYARLKVFAEQFGLTPASRARLAPNRPAKKADKADPWDQV